MSGATFVITTAEYFLFAPVLLLTGRGVVYGAQFVRREDAELLLSDRKANGEAFPGEFVARGQARVFAPTSSDNNAYHFYTLEPVADDGSPYVGIPGVYKANDDDGTLVGSFCGLAEAVIGGFDFDSIDKMSLSDAHNFIVHSDGGPCPDGCDSWGDPKRIAVYQRTGCSTFGCACSYEGDATEFREADAKQAAQFWKAIGDVAGMTGER